MIASEPGSRRHRVTRWPVQGDALAGGLDGTQERILAVAPGAEELSWRLIEMVQPFVARSVAQRIYALLGGGDPFGAMNAILRCVVRAGIPLEDPLLHTLHLWLDCYRGQDAELPMRHLLTQAGTISAANARERTHSWP